MGEQLLVNWKGYEWRRPWPIQSTIPPFTWNDRGKPRKTSLRISSPWL